MRKKKPRRKRSAVWFIEREDLEQLVAKSETIGQVLAHFGLRNHGSNYQTLKRRLQADGIDFSKFGKNYGSGLLKPLIPLELVLVAGSTFSRTPLKARLLKGGLLENICAECGQLPEWKGKRLVMVLDHVNGKNDDHRLENLRLICPNCNSQTTTFAGRNKRRIGE